MPQGLENREFVPFFQRHANNKLRKRVGEFHLKNTGEPMATEIGAAIIEVVYDVKSPVPVTDLDRLAAQLTFLAMKQT
jgi:hypothetical protein